MVFKRGKADVRGEIYSSRLKHWFSNLTAEHPALLRRFALKVRAISAISALLPV